MGTELMRAEGRKIAHKPAKRRAGGGNDDDRIGSCSHGRCSSILALRGGRYYLHDIHHMMRRKICNGRAGNNCGEIASRGGSGIQRVQLSASATADDPVNTAVSDYWMPACAGHDGYFSSLP